MDRQELERVFKGFLEGKRKPQVKQPLMTAPTQKPPSHASAFYSFLDPIETLNLFTSYRVKLISAYHFFKLVFL